MDIRIKEPTINIYDSLYRRVYLYVCTGLPDNNTSMLAPDSYSFIAVSQLPFNDYKNNLSTDEAGNLFCNVIAAMTESETFSATTSTDGFAESLYRARQFTALSNNFPIMKNEVLVCTIDAPMTFDTFGNRTDLKNPVYIITSSNSTIQQDDWYQVKENLYNDETYAEFVCADIELLQERYANCAFNFYKNNLGYIANPINQLRKPGLTLTIPKGGFLANNNMTLITNTDNKKERRVGLQVDKTNIKLFPWKMYSSFFDNDTLSMYQDWLDISTYTPISLMLQYATASDLKLLFGSPLQDTPQGNALQLIYDILAVTYLYMTTFQPSNSPSDWRLAPTAGVSGLGQIDAKFSVGLKYPRNVLQISAQSPSVVIDGMFNDWVSQNPSADIGLKKLTKSVITLLSRYIPSNYSIAGGGNDAYKSVLPWSLVPSGFTLKFETNKVSMDTTNLTFTFDSEYFTIDTATQTLVPNDKAYLPTSVWEIEGEQSQFMPRVPSTLSPEDPNGDAKEMLPAAMLSTSQKALEYLWYIPLTNASDFVNIIKGQTSSGPQTIDKTGISTLSSPWTQNVLTAADAPGYLTQFLRDIYGSSATIEIVDVGTITTTPGQSANFKFSYNNDKSDFIDQYGKPWPVINNQRALNEQELRQVVKEWIYPDNNDITQDRIQITRITNAWAQEDDSNVADIYFINIDIAYEINNYYLSNAHAKITYSSFIFKSNKLIYNSDEWYDYLKNQNISLTSLTTLNYNEVNSNEIGKIKKIIVGLLWTESLKLDLGAYVFKIDALFNSTDESIVLQQILFT